MKRKLEETLQECLAALAEGQSTVEECLALYPELAVELEPLLHTACKLQDVYAVDPSPLYAQAARERFLSAMARRRQKRLAAQPVRPFWRWAPAAVGSAALVVFAVWASVLAWAGGGGGGAQEPPIGVEKVTPTETPVPVVMSDIQEQVERVQNNLEAIRTGAETGGAVEPVVFQQLKEDTEALVASLDEAEALELEDVSQIGELLADQEEVLKEVKQSVPPEAAGDVDEIIRIAGEGRSKVEKRLSPTASPTPSATPTATPSATPSPTPTAAPEESPTPTATPTATSTATETPEPPPSPTPEGGEEPSPTATAAP